MVSVATLLPVASTTATFTPVRRPGSRPSVGRGPGGGRGRRGGPCSPRTPPRASAPARGLPQAHADVDPQVHEHARGPGPADGLQQPAVARPAAIGDAEPLRDV